MRASSSNSLVSYPGHLLEWSGVLLLRRDTVSVFYSPNQLGFCWLGMIYIVIEESSSLTGVIRMNFALVFGSEFILGIGERIGDLCEFFSGYLF